MSNRFGRIFLLGFLCFSFGSQSEDETAPLEDNFLERFSDAPEYNGIAAKEAKNFWIDWHLVTTRFRKDSDQVRLTYANDLAWAALKEGKKFPKGAMFGKLVYRAEDDPVFTSSTKPGRLIRVLVMKKDDKKYPEQNGWGYGIFEGTKSLVREDKQKYAVAACHACHKVVANKDYVFSEPIFGAGKRPKATSTASFGDQFKIINTSELNAFAKSALESVVPKTSSTGVPQVSHLSMTLFSGALRTSVGSLDEYVRRDSRPYLLLDESRQTFLAVAPAPRDDKCAKQSVYVMQYQSGSKTKIKRGKVCDGRRI